MAVPEGSIPDRKSSRDAKVERALSVEVASVAGAGGCGAEGEMRRASAWRWGPWGPQGARPCRYYGDGLLV